MFWLDLDDISITEQVADSLSADNSNTSTVNIGAIGGLQVLAIDQGREVVQLVLFIDDCLLIRISKLVCFFGEVSRACLRSCSGGLYS